MERIVKPLVMALTALGLVVAFGYLLYLGWSMVSASDYLAVRGLGAGIILLTGVGAWATWAIVRNGLDVADMERRPSGRLQHDAADALFDRVSAEYQAAPDDWRTTYRLARAYDHAGDRVRAREVMKAAIGLRETELTSGKGLG